MAAEPTIFARIAAGEIPSQKVYEDERVFAFLDINPLADGHTLLIPKRQVARLEDLPDEDVAALARVLPVLTRRILAATGAPACNVLLNNGGPAGQEVQHVHFHIIPRRDGDGLGFRWHKQTRTGAQLEEVAQRIAVQN